MSDYGLVEKVTITGNIKHTKDKTVIKKVTNITSKKINICKFIRSFIHNNYRIAEFYNEEHYFRTFLLSNINYNLMPNNLLLSVICTNEYVKKTIINKNYNRQNNLNDAQRYTKCCIHTKTKKKIIFDDIDYNFISLKYDWRETMDLHDDCTRNNGNLIVFSNKIKNNHQVTYATTNHFKYVDITDLDVVCNYSKPKQLYFIMSKSVL